MTIVILVSIFMTLAAAARLLAAMDARLDCQILMATAGSGGDDTARAD